MTDDPARPPLTNEELAKLESGWRSGRAFPFHEIPSVVAELRELRQLIFEAYPYVKEISPGYLTEAERQLAMDVCKRMKAVLDRL